MPEPAFSDLIAVVDALEWWIPRLLPDAERSRAMVAACRAAADAPVTDEPFALGLGRIERAAQQISRHVLLFVEADGSLVPTTDEPDWPPPDLRAIRRRGGGVGAVTRTVDGIATLRLDRLDPLDIAEPFIEAAFALMERATGLVLDLRTNGGGDPATVAFLAGYALGPPARPLARVDGRDGPVEWSTLPPAACLAADVPMAVLTGPDTFSAAEALAYHLRSRDRAVVVGERSPGAADHATPVVLTPFVHSQLPTAAVVDAVTGTSWEGVGVEVDLPAAVADAEAVAHDWIRRRWTSGAGAAVAS